MKTITKIGIGFLIFGVLALAGLFYVVVLVGVGGSGNPPAPSPWRELITVALILGSYSYVFIIVGVVLIAVGALQERHSIADLIRA